MQKKKVVIIGGGAAGFFCAANLSHPHLDIILLEKTNKLLSKVKVSGGGRCNVTNGLYEKQSDFSSQYPRGKNVLKKTLFQFSYMDTVRWFEKRDVRLKMESDGRMFPLSDDSQTIVDCLIQEGNKNNVRIITQCDVIRVRKINEQFLLTAKDNRTFNADYVCVAIGGSPQIKHYSILEGHIEVEHPVPSLFTFNLPGHSIRELMGVSVPDASVKIQGTKLTSRGPLLITHWGLSGPAVLRLSAWGARELADKNWHFNININWSGIENEEEARTILSKYIASYPNKAVKNAHVFEKCPARFWQFILSESDIPPVAKLHELNKKQINKLIHNIFHYECSVKGKTTFKEEFVTAGGFSTQEVSLQTFESKSCPGLYIIGECLNIDGITGGFNFQNAWTSGYIVAKDILRQV